MFVSFLYFSAQNLIMKNFKNIGKLKGLSSNYVYAYGLFIHSPVDGHLGHFQFVTIMSKTAINILVQFSL